jgi:hypothetical protein
MFSKFIIIYKQKVRYKICHLFLALYKKYTRTTKKSKLGSQLKNIHTAIKKYFFRCSTVLNQYSNCTV